MLTATLLVLAATAGYLTGDPLHQKACYKLDRDPARTTQQLTGGHGEVTVDELTTAADGSKQYTVALRYNFDVALFGWQQGTMSFHVPAAYFTPAMLPQLRAGHALETPGFDLAWVDQGTVTTLDGVTATNADRVHVSNLVPLDPDTNFSDLDMLAYLVTGVPSLGAIKIDMTGKMYGFPFKAGIDYTEDPTQCFTP